MGRPPHEERERAAPPPKLFHFLGCRMVTLRHVDGLALLKQRYQGFPVDHAQWRWRGSPSVGLAVGKASIVNRQPREQYRRSVAHLTGSGSSATMMPISLAASGAPQPGQGWSSWR